MATYRKPKLLPPGEYDVEITGATERRSGTTGNDMFVVELRAKNNVGRRFTLQDWLVLNDQCDWKFEEFLKAIGLDLEDGEQIDTEDFVGATARALIGIREFHDREQNCVRRWLPKLKHTPGRETSIGTSNPSVTQANE